MLPIRLIWSKAKSNLLFGNWYNHKNIIGKDIYHLMEFYNKEDNVVHDINNNFILRFKDNILKFRNNVMRLESISCVVEEFLNEKQVKYQKEKRFLGYPGYLRRGYKRRYYHLVFPLLCKLFPTSIRDFSNYRRRFPDGITFQLPDNKLYILVGVEGVGNPLIPAIFFLTHPAAYIQICGICDENRLFVEELELKITGKLKQNPNIKFLTPESTKYDIN